MDDPGWPDLLISVIALFIIAMLARIGSIGSAISKTTLERLLEEGIPRTRFYLWFYRSRDFTSQMILLGQTLAVAVGTFSLPAFFVSKLGTFGLPIPLLYLVWACIYVLLALLIKNATPPYRREEGSEHPLPNLPITLLPLTLVLILPTLLLQKAQNLFVSEDDNKARKEEELRNLVESETEEGTIEAEEREMIEGIFEFRDTTVKEVMIPRIDMVCAEITSSPNDLLELIRETRHSRIPIYKERIDNIKGVVYVKDILIHQNTEKPWIIADITRPPYFVPENKKLDELMSEFKKEKVHMAIVVGEYGGTSGLVTLEDIIEEIVGEIQDEYDEEEPLFKWNKEETILIADARIDIEDLNDLLNVEIPQDGYETLGGFIYNHLGHVPEPGESLAFSNLMIVIKEIEGQRIARVQIEKREIRTDPEPENAEIA